MASLYQLINNFENGHFSLDDAMYTGYPCEMALWPDFTELVMKLEDLETASMEEMLDFYNANTKKKLKQFADRPTAIQRVTKIIERLEEKPAPVEPTDEEIEAKKEASRLRRHEGTKRSWANETTAAKRKARHGVEVDGVYYKSVGEAYRQLGLPMNKRISHRIDLKQKGEDYEYTNPATGQQYHWLIVPYRKVEPKPKAPKVTPTNEETAPVEEALVG
jgi:hypothetical protein